MDKTVIKQRVKAYLDLVRPFTLLAPIIVSICIMIASYVYADYEASIFNYVWTMIIPASLSFAFLNGASNALNQVTDLEADKISKAYRPIPSGAVSTNEALSISLLMYMISFTLSILINIWFVLFIFLIALFTITYSLPPRLKDKLIFNQLWVGIPRGLLAIMASWSVFGNSLQPLPLAIALIAMSFLIGGSITKDIIDAEADKKTGTNTLVNTFGVKKAAIMALPFMFFPFVFIPILINSGILNIQFFILTFLCIPAFFIFYLMIRDTDKHHKLENTSSWALMYITYFVFAFGFSILTITG